MNKFSLELKNKVVNDYNQGLILNLDTYLREIGIARSTFYVWLKKYNNQDAIRFIDITDKINNSQSCITLKIKDVELILDNNYNEELLLRVINSLRLI